MSATKYVKTSLDHIIVFCGEISHDYFRDMNIVSAGFISFEPDTDGSPRCTCYGDSFSLKLKSDKEDTFLANLQLFNKVILQR